MNNASPSVIYSHRQRGTLIIWLATGGAVVMLVALIAASFDEPAVLVGLLPLAIVCAIAWQFSSLTITVTNDAIAWRFGPGVLKWSLRLDDVASVEVTRTSFFVGWGIRWTPSGMVYNVSGLDAVRIDRRDGRSIRLGTDEPEALAAAIERAREGVLVS